MSLKKLREKIEKENKMFNSLKPNEKAIKIVEDCLERIKLKQFDIQKGNYLGRDFIYDFKNDESVRDILNSRKSLPSCQVCAKGALFMSHIGRVNKCTIDELYNRYVEICDSNKELDSIFPNCNYHLIEIAFEMFHVDDDVETPIMIIIDNFDEEEAEKLINKACEFGEKYNDSKSRLKAICKNIIKNNGVFKP